MSRESCEHRGVECNNFASSQMSQNHTLWNLDFRFSLGTLFQESDYSTTSRSIHVMSYEHKPDRHFFEQKYECPGMDPMRTTPYHYEYHVRSTTNHNFYIFITMVQTR